MKKILLPALFWLFVATPMYAQTDSALALSDWSEVVEAVNRVNADGGGTIRLKSNSTITVGRSLPAIIGNITFEGNGATLTAKEGYIGSLITIQSGAQLLLQDLHVTGFQLGLETSPAEHIGLIDNSGQLILDRVTLANNPLCDDCESSLSLLVNRSWGSLNNVTIYENDTKNEHALINRGDLRFTNSTLSNNRVWRYSCECISMGCVKVCIDRPSHEVMSTTWGSTTEFGNTLITGETEILGSVSDLGGNFVPASRPDQTEAQRAGLGSFGNHGGLVPTVSLEPGSGAIDAGNSEICSATDARFANRPVSGSIHSEPKCDAGAFEYGGAFGNADLAVNGMNGLWFSQASDGHYVHVWRVSPDRVYINWTAFNQSADQMWIYAVADTVGESRFSATAYINEGGQLVPGAAPEGSVANEWGSVEIELTSCTVGTFRYASNDSAIGSGEFQIDRLAFVEGGGCSD